MTGGVELSPGEAERDREPQAAVRETGGTYRRLSERSS